MIAAIEALRGLLARGCALTVVGDQIQLHYPGPIVPAELVALVRTHKLALLALLTTSPLADLGAEEQADWLEAWAERAAIMEYDGELTREQAEWEAWTRLFGGEPNFFGGRMGGGGAS